jgi:uracil-DNA glycosylase
MREIKNSRDNKLPYINGEADGLAMSSYGKITPSLEVVFEEINRCYSQWKRTQTHLDDWAEQGVLLINAALTTRLGKSRAHQGWGWEIFAQEVFRCIHKLKQPVVLMGWGRDAQSVVTENYRTDKHGPRLFLKTVHPQAQNYDPTKKFVGCNHFIQANLFLIKHGLSPIWWSDPVLMNHYTYTELICELQKQCKDATIDLSKIVYSYPPVEKYKRHPFDPGLGQKHNEDLPF